ncbi:hypothetical protein, partial [Coprococcus catus]|uniref:hypothetical protein n=1 Tax=Coprococcus catus TaxID=116085 RepID=UPI001C023DA2
AVGSISSISLKSVNLFFSMIYGLMCFLYAVFKVHARTTSGAGSQQENFGSLLTHWTLVENP